MAIALPASPDASSMADWAELQILTAEGPALSIAELSNILDEEGTEAAEVEIEADEEEEQPADAALEVAPERLDTELDARIEQMLDEIDLRRRVGESVYPFEQDRQRIVRRSVPGEHAYLLLLILSVEDAPYRKDKRTNEVERAYDLVALEALRRFLGREAQAVRFARNSNDPEDPENTRPERFDEAIKWLRDKLDLGPHTESPPPEEGNPHWEDVQYGLEPLRSYSDAGVDVVAWWRFKDDRMGFPVLLAQCTVQLKWERKLKDVDPDLWRGWINFGTVPPQKCLVIPFAVDRDAATWPHRTVQAGVIIDRVRLIELLDELEDDELEQLIDSETRSWVRQELEGLRHVRAQPTTRNRDL